MKYELVISGFGGQGVMLLGQILVSAGMIEGKNVSWIPSYGAEMRGGSANCAVIVSDQKIGSPLVNTPGILVAMNLPSLDKFEGTVKPGGTILVNSSLIHRRTERSDVTVRPVPVNDIANELKNSRVVNMVMLGAVAAATGIVSKESLMGAFRKMFEKKFADKPHLFQLNETAIEKGMAHCA